MSKALQEFDLALRGKKKRAKFLKDGKKKELTVLIILTHPVRQLVYLVRQSVSQSISDSISDLLSQAANQSFSGAVNL